MNEPFCRRVRADWRVAWVHLIGASLLLLGSQAGAVNAGAHPEARRQAIELLRRAQNESGQRSVHLPRAYERIQLGLAESKNDPLQHGQWLAALWEYHLLHDDHAQAKQALEQSLQFLTAGGADHALIGTVTCNLSYSLILLGEVAKAKDLLRRAIVSATQHDNHTLLAELYYSLGDAYRKTGERLVAQRYFEAAYELDSASGDEIKISISKLKLGSLARDRGAYREAIDWHEQALRIFSGRGSYRELVTHIELGRDFAALGDLTRAQSYTQRALDDGRALPEQRIDASVLMLRLTSDQRERAAETRAYAGRADDLVRDIRTLINGSTARQKSEFARPTHQLLFAEQAIRHYALNRDLASVRAQGEAAIRLAQRVAHDLRATNDDSLAWLTAAQPVLNEYVQALYELDRSQVLPLLETYYAQQSEPAALRHSGVVGRAYEAETVELFERYRTARTSLIDATGALDRLHPTASDPSRLREAKARVEQALREWDRARDAYLTTYQPVLGMKQTPNAATSHTQSLRLKEAATLGSQPIPATDIFIRYFIQENVSFGIAIAGREIHHFDLPPRSVVQAMVRRSLEALSAPGRGAQTEAALSSLAQLLPRDFIRQLRDVKRLVIVPDDIVQPLPFAAIDLDDRPQTYAPLVEQFQIVRAKSLSGYYAAQPQPPHQSAKTADIVVFADPVLGTQPMDRVQPRAVPSTSSNERLPTLPNTRIEAASIERIFATRVNTYAGATATNDVLLSPKVRAAKILHIATHGYFNTTTPDIVGLVTSSKRGSESDSGFLGFTELFSAPFSSSLVVVSGCETMRGKDYSGWGVRSLADGFLSQGAGSVVGTLWSVSDAATAALMDAFYRELHRGVGSAAALQAAQRQLIASRRFTDPYYWAGVALESSNRGFDAHAL